MVCLPKIINKLNDSSILLRIFRCWLLLFFVLTENGDVSFFNTNGAVGVKMADVV